MSLADWAVGFVSGMAVLWVLRWAKVWPLRREPYSDEPSAAYPLKVVDDPESVPVWETVGYLTAKEYHDLDIIGWMRHKSEILVEFSIVHGKPDAATLLLNSTNTLRVRYIEMWDHLIARRGWDPQRMHDSEYALTYQYRTIRRAMPEQQAISAHKSSRESKTVNA